MTMLLTDTPSTTMSFHTRKPIPQPESWIVLKAWQATRIVGSRSLIWLRGTEYWGAREHHESHFYLAIEGIGKEETRSTKVKEAVKHVFLADRLPGPLTRDISFW